MTLFARAVPNSKHHLSRMQKRALGDQPNTQSSNQQTGQEAGQEASQQTSQTSNNVFKADQPQSGKQESSSVSNPENSSPDR